MTIQELRVLCVDSFPQSKTRQDIMLGLEEIVAELRNAQVEGELWIDGSFTTEKIDPEDSDIVLCVQGDFYDSAHPQQRDTIDWIDSNLKFSHQCDSYVHFEFPKGHVHYALSEWMRAYWIRQFGFSRADDIKGLALVRL